ncbi:MAG: tRNA adenosine(34) deaminase TadA [Halothiobacillaceae bacterium]
MNHRDQDWMAQALDLARQAASDGEVPVGAVVVDSEGRLIGTGRNGPISTSDPTAHAEILALRSAAEAIGNYRLGGCTLYVTLEPCAMCVGAMVHARIQRLVFGAPDPRTGCCGSATDLIRAPFHNHRIMIDGGLMGEESARLLRDFFRARRKGRAVDSSG